MLVLTRRFGEAINIGEEIVVRVVGVSGGKVRLAIDAPPEVRIDRMEVRQRLNEIYSQWMQARNMTLTGSGLST